ncbi:alkaline phosphatase D family protein [Actinomadura alba]|uniref:Alkaline phosphatase D family protein n=2 Tax=Actinomadura alba TaxID=406431 RepID=A0ABR7LRY0_9ACTN|nr:alkaline phosphatase D family protein [Actinomadura alba]
MGLAVAGSLPGIARADSSAVEVTDLRSDPFTLGIASGDPLSDSVVIWTRLAPEPLAPFGGLGPRPVTVLWQVAEDEQFGNVVRSGTARARREQSYSVHIDVQGLRPWRHYYYRFRVGRHLSPVGRTRTAPQYGRPVPGLSFAFASCQAYWEGFFTAYRDMAAQEHDVVFHMGDYIYEYGVGVDSGVRRQPVPVDFTRETMTLDEYRGRYALYKTDPDLQAAHAAAPWIVTLDDHEVDNNWAGPISENNTPQDEFLVRRANAFRAWWEHMPVRMAQSPTGPDMQLYRRFQYGDLVRFNMLDTRQYRDNQAAGDGSKPPNPESLDPDRTITGDAQEKWLLDGMAERSARWEVLAHQTAIAQLDVKAGPEILVPMDTWDGYAASRQRVLDGAQERGVRNLVSIVGDLHRSIVSELKADYANDTAPVVGTEFVGTSISSGLDGMDNDQGGLTILAENPHVKFTNFQRGYVRVDVTPEQWVADYRVADRVIVPDGTISTRARLVVKDGDPSIHVVGGQS